MLGNPSESWIPDSDGWIPDSKLSVIPDSNVPTSGCHSYFKGQHFFEMYEVVYLN